MSAERRGILRLVADAATLSGLYTVHEEVTALSVQWPIHPDEPYFRFETMMVPALRDANATAGTWPEVVTLEHVPVAFDPVHPLVPLFEGDTERRLWRRRKWWGRGPIVFGRWGRESALIAADVERVSGIKLKNVEWGPMIFSGAWGRRESLLGDGPGTAKGAG